MFWMFLSFLFWLSVIGLVFRAIFAITSPSAGFGGAGGGASYSKPSWICLGIWVASALVPLTLCKTLPSLVVDQWAGLIIGLAMPIFLCSFTVWGLCRFADREIHRESIYRRCRRPEAPRGQSSHESH
jgi:hypothetical protein